MIIIHSQKLRAGLEWAQGGRLTISEGSSESYVDVNFAFWLQVNLKTTKQQNAIRFQTSEQQHRTNKY